MTSYSDAYNETATTIGIAKGLATALRELAVEESFFSTSEGNALFSLILTMQEKLAQIEAGHDAEYKAWRAQQ